MGDFDNTTFPPTLGKTNALSKGSSLLPTFSNLLPSALGLASVVRMTLVRITNGSILALGPGAMGLRLGACLVGVRSESGQSLVTCGISGFPSWVVGGGGVEGEGHSGVSIFDLGMSL